MNTQDFCYWLQGYFELSGIDEDLSKEISEGLRRTGLGRVERHKKNMENRQEYLESIRLKVDAAMAETPPNRYII